MCNAHTQHSFKVTQFGQPLEHVTETPPPPTGTEVLLRVRACGVCHSDVHLHDGYFDLGNNNKLDMSRSVPLPRTLGHEIVAEVVQVGPDSAPLEKGNVWLVYPWIGCGTCAVCASGEEHLCAQPRALGVAADGGFSDFVRVPHSRYLIDFGTIPEHVACTYACSGLTAYSALKKAAPISSTSPVLIIGAGGVGQSAIRLSEAVFGIGATVADIDPAKRAAALEIGASIALDPNDRDACKTHLKATGGYAAVIDFVGAGSTVQFGMNMLRKGGKLIIVGLFGGKIDLPIPTLPLRPISLIGSYVGSPSELRELVEIAREKELPSIDVQTRPLSSAQDVLNELRAGKVRGRAVLVP